VSKYVLTLRNTNTKLKIRVNGENYFIYADTARDMFFAPLNDFKLKEKLYILNYTLDVVWTPICDVKFAILQTLFSFIKPKHLVIKPTNGRVLINVNKYL